MPLPPTHVLAVSAHSPPGSRSRRSRAIVASLATGSLVCTGLALVELPALAGVGAPASGSAALGKSGGTYQSVAASGNLGAGLTGSTKTVRYAGASFTVPNSWPVFHLERDPSTCVRFNRHAVYLGTPAVDQNCPAHAVGRTEALLVQPTRSVPANSLMAASVTGAARLGVRPMLSTKTLSSGELVRSYTDAQLTVTATFGARPALAVDLLAGARQSGTFTARPNLSAKRSNNAMSDPGSYRAASTATLFRGQGFDTCMAPSTNAMRAWLRSSYRSVGIYIGGLNRACGWGNLSPSWVTTVSRMGWRLQPIYVGLQPYCTDQQGMAAIATRQTTAKRQGLSAAGDAVTSAKALGLTQGSTIYNDIESYNNTISSCVESTMSFLDGWTRGLHDHGYLSGVYSSAYSAIQNMAQRYRSKTFARPDVVWTARWDGVVNTAEPVLGTSMWSTFQRAKQYRGDHYETWDGYRIDIDSDYLHTTMGTTTFGYPVQASEPVNVHSGPNTSFAVTGQRVPGQTVNVMCQVTNAYVGATPVWDKLASGDYITDHYVGTPSSTGYSKPLPKCNFALMVTASTGLTLRAGPGTHYQQVGFRAYASLVAVVCQAPGERIGGSPAWNQLSSGKWVPDYYTSDIAKPHYSKVIPRCP